MPQSNKEANILLSLRAYQNNPKLSLRRAANIYQVNSTTLWRRQQGILSTHNTINKHANYPI
jgi:hypothetical protein